MNQERSLVSVIAALFERLAARALALFALCVVIGFALLSEVLSRNALARSADVIESLLGMYADPSGEPTTVAPDMLTSALLGMGDGARFVILRTVSSADGMPKVYYLSPGMPAKLIEEAGKAASPDELRQRIVGSVADRGWRYALYHRQSAGFDLYVSASRLPDDGDRSPHVLMLVALPVAVLLAPRGAPHDGGRVAAAVRAGWRCGHRPPAEPARHQPDRDRRADRRGQKAISVGARR
jgi:hypothetical protein